MTRARATKPTAPPLADTLRAALAAGWHTLSALEALAGRAAGARLRVHAALAELRAAGAVVEERIERGVAEVRLAQAAPVEDASVAPPEPFPAPAAPLPAVDPTAPAETADGAATAARGPGPSSRCAVCGAAYRRHVEGGAAKPAPGACDAFRALPRGRPRAASSRLSAAQAADPDVTELPSPAEQRAILDGMAARWDAAVAERAEERAAAPAPDARPLYETLKAAGDVRVVPEGGEGSAVVYAPEPDAASEVRRLVPSGHCRPPLCHRDDIIIPSAVRSFARPLCAACRAWVEGEGGTVTRARRHLT